ncbi:ATP-binding cassette domain-containing protein [Streptomyces sp. NBC_01317]|uniref:ATP-binding cassette domain-containing protein n=1 Tax=Streptomyces sp. NBC_01317 TaxID=2903822 RepID=UPI002E1282E2|nr:ATP-binding cassette domain-containing protein [Streptomyces sp. NBC_01317]
MTAHAPAPGAAPEMRLKIGQHDTASAAVSTLTMARRLPATLRATVRLGWRADRRALVGMLTAQTLTAVLAAVALAMTTRVIGALLNILAAYTDDHHVRPLFAEAVPATVTVAVCLTGAALTEAASRAAAARLGPRCAREADLEVLRAAAAVELSAYEHPGFEDNLEAAGKGAELTRDLVIDAQALISSLAQMTAAVAVLSALHPVLLGLLLLAALPRGWAAVKAARIQHATVHATLSDSRLRTLLRGYCTDRNTAAEIRACGMGGFLTHRYGQVSDRLEKEGLAAALRALRTQLAGDAVSALAMAAAWAALAGLVAAGRIDLAAAGTALFALRTSNGALAGMTQAGARLFRTSLYLEDWIQFLAEARAHRTHRGTLAIPDSGPDVIAARGLSFTYPGTTAPAVSGVDLEIKRGEVIALVGENGSGKTTLAHLLTGLYLPSSGTVAWDDVDLADADPATVWARLAMVPQDYTRWPLTCRENITLGSANDGDTAVRAAAEAAGAITAIDKLPAGLDTSLARSWWGGHDLSGGQWQRIAIARAFHRDAPVHILDEPTAALDARAEHKIFARLKTLAEGSTALFITHRLANARVADRIIVMREGRIAESGTYHDLLQRPGSLFGELHRLQDGQDDA